MNSQDCLAVFKKVSELLNEQIREHGKLQKNNKIIWDTLHSMDNDIWHAYVQGIKIINREFPHLVNMTEFAQVIKVSKILNDYGDLSTSGNILTPYKTRRNGHNYKGDAWKLICQGREIWNRSMCIDLPNEDSSKRGPADNILDFANNN